MQNLKINTRLPQIIFLFSILLFFYLVSLKFNFPLAEWDEIYYQTAVDWSNGIWTPWVRDHTPGYSVYLAIAFKIFGASILKARVANALCVFFTGILLFMLTKKLTNKSTAMIASSIFLLTPSIIQGSGSMDVADTTLLPLGFLLYFIAVLNSCRDKYLMYDILLIALSTMFCYWSKITSTIAIIIGISTYLAFNFKRLDYQWVKKIILGSLLGSILFLITWFMVSYGLWGEKAFLSMFMFVNSMPGKVITSSTSLRLIQGVVDIARIILWLSPFLLIFSFSKMYKVLKTPIKSLNDRKLHILAWTVSFYFIAYTLYAGTSSGYPRYHIGVLSILILFAVLAFQNNFDYLKNRNVVVDISLSLTLFFVYIAFLPDIIYLVNFELKRSMIFGYTSEIIFHISLMIILFYLIPFVLLPIFKYIYKETTLAQRIQTVFLFAFLAGMLFFNIKHATANYFTSYYYGTKGHNELITEMSKHIDNDDNVMALPVILYSFREKNVPSVPWSIWKTEKLFYKWLLRLDPKVIVFGETTHTYPQWKFIQKSDKIQDILKQKYKFSKIGTYHLYIKK